MTDPRRQRIEDLFEQALALEPGARAALLAAACGDDDGLRREVESLVARAATEPGGFRATVAAAAANLAASLSPPVPGLVPGSRIGAGRYSVIRLLGRGGMGAVYLASDEVLGKPVALKVVDDTGALDRLRAEVHLAQEVTDRNVCRTYDLEDVDGRWLVKMEFVDGRTLADRIAAGRLPIAEVRSIGRQIALGLGAAHDRGVIHRDLKPHNVVIEHGSGRVVLMDFGIARRGGDDGGMPAGTPATMAPEQIRGEPVDHRTDLYALGCVLYTMLTGAAVFPADSAPIMLERHLADPPPDPRAARPDTPPWLAHLVRRLLDKDPARRPRAAAEVAAALAPPRRRGVAVLAVAVAAVAAAAVVAALVLRPSRPEASWRPVLRGAPVEDDYTFGPVFSPDGKHLAYVANRGNHWRIFVESIADGSVRVIGPPDVSVHVPTWTPDGTAITCETYGQSTARTSPLRIPLTDGAPTEALAERPPQRCGAGVARVLDAGPGCPDCMRLVVIDGAGREHPIARSTVDRRFLGIGCDDGGRHIVYAIFSSGFDPMEIWVASVDGGAPRKLGDSRSPATIHPDGRSVIASLNRTGRWNLWELAVEGPDATQLTSGPGPDHSVTISPDGRLLVFLTGELLWRHSKILAYAVPGGAVRALTRRVQSLHNLRLAADGQHLVAEARRDGDGGPLVVVVATADGTERTLAPGHAPSITPDGAEVVFAVGRDPATLFAMPIGGGPRRELGSMPGWVRRTDVGGDGRVHAWVISRDASWAWHVPLAGGPAGPEAPPPWMMILPAPVGGWSIAFRGSDESVDAHLLAPGMTLDDPAARVVREVAIDSVAWTLDGAAVTYADHATVHRLEVATGEDRVLLELPQEDWNDMVLARDGKTLYVAMGAAHNTRQLISNFGDRPRP